MATGDPWAFNEKINLYIKSTPMIRCEYCGRKVSSEEPFCPSCGAPLPDEPFDEGGLFCNDYQSPSHYYRDVNYRSPSYYKR